MDGSDVNAADRSPSGRLLAVGDDFGKVNKNKSKYPFVTLSVVCFTCFLNSLATAFLFLMSPTSPFLYSPLPLFFFFHVLSYLFLMTLFHFSPCSPHLSSCSPLAFYGFRSRVTDIPAPNQAYLRALHTPATQAMVRTYELYFICSLPRLFRFALPCPASPCIPFPYLVFSCSTLSESKPTSNLFSSIPTSFCLFCHYYSSTTFITYYSLTAAKISDFFAVTQVRWMGDTSSKSSSSHDKYLISLGGEDKCIFQWYQNKCYICVFRTCTDGGDNSLHSILTSQFIIYNYSRPSTTLLLFSGVSRMIMTIARLHLLSLIVIHKV
jgi:hypothetical protein